MHGEKLTAVSRTTVVALVILIVLSSGGIASASMAPSHQSATTEYNPGACPLPNLDLSLDFVQSDAPGSNSDLSEHSNMIVMMTDDLINTFSASGNGVALPVGAVLFRYSRYDDSDPLDNDVRQQIFNVIERSPGTYISEVSEEVDASRSTVRYHVRILEEERLIVGEAVRGKHRFYPVGSDDPQLAAALNDDSTARVLDAIARLETATVSTLADELDRSPGTISYHLNRLTDDGLLERERKGNTVVTRLANEVIGEVLNRDPTITPAKAD